MEPITAIVLLFIVGAGGALLAHVNRKGQAQKYGEISLHTIIAEKNSLPGSQPHPSALCSTQDRQHVAPVGAIKPYTGSAPIANRASNPLFQWTYVVAPGDSPGRIAEGYTGDRNRFVELVAANASKPMKNYGGEINFADFCVGERLYLPRSWNPWVDEVGNPRKNKIPFPPYDTMPLYPSSALGKMDAGYIPWPPAMPTGWTPIPSAPTSPPPAGA